MKQSRQRRELEEPIGIVIAGPERGEVAPRFAAFVWGPAPDAVSREHAPDVKAA